MTANELTTADDTDLLALVTEQVKALRPETDAQVWHSGGGIFGILLKVSEENEAFFGITDEIWAGDLMTSDGDFIEGISTGLPSDERDPAYIARVLIESLDKHNTA